MARLHATFSLQGSEELALGHDPSRPVLWTQLDDWLQVALRNEASTAGGGGGGGSGLLPTAESIRAELDWARGRVAESAAASGAPRGDENPRFEVAFCHNDVLAANVLWDDISRTVQLIDFEYGGYNYAAFDLANHFNERAGGPPHDSVPDYGLFPSAEEQREFLSDYLLARDRFGGGGGGGRPGHRGEEKADEGGRSRGAGLSIAAAAPPVDPARLTALGEEVRFFVLVNHLYWGLWALNQSSSEGNDVYDYLTYAVERFRQYYKSKHQMALQEESKGGEGGEGE
jgi:ethanolamine kinase